MGIKSASSPPAGQNRFPSQCRAWQLLWRQAVLSQSISPKFLMSVWKLHVVAGAHPPTMGPDFYIWHSSRVTFDFWSVDFIGRPWAWPLFCGLDAHFPYFFLTYIVEMLT